MRKKCLRSDSSSAPEYATQVKTSDVDIATEQSIRMEER